MLSSAEGNLVRKRLAQLWQAKDTSLDYWLDINGFVAGQDRLKRNELFRSWVACGNSELHRYRGMFPCLRAGKVSRFVFSVRNAFVMYWRESSGSITLSIVPRSAAR